MGSPAGPTVDKGGWARPVDNFTSKATWKRGLDPGQDHPVLPSLILLALVLALATGACVLALNVVGIGALILLDSSRQPRYRRLANVEATRQVGLAGATVGERIQGLALLMSGKLWRSTHMNPTRLGASSTFPGSGTDQFTFKLGEAAKNS